MDNKEITNYASPKCSTIVNGFGLVWAAIQ